MKALLSYLAVIVMLAIAGTAGVIAAQPHQSPRYVIDGRGSPDGGVLWLVTAACSERPTGWQSARAVCDWTTLQAVVVTAEVYGPIHQGDQFP